MITKKSLNPLMDSYSQEAFHTKIEEDHKGKPVIGICNGAQILVETAMIPELSKDDLEMSLARNIWIKNNKTEKVGGFYNEWIYIKNNSKQGRSAFNNFKEDLIMKIPIAHGEGRFTSQNKEVIKTLKENDQTIFRYCDKDGNIKEDFPTNPNHSLYNLAGICNKEGNVLALMPHPERTEKEGQPIFDSMATYIKNGNKIKKDTTQLKTIKKDTTTIEKSITKQKTKPDIEIKIELIITDNTQKTLENTMKKQKSFKSLKLKRKLYYAFNIKNKNDAKKIAQQIIETGEIANLNKEIPIITIKNKDYKYSKDSGLLEIEKDKTNYTFYVTEYKNYEGETTMTKLKNYFKNEEIQNIEQGIYWDINLKQDIKIKSLLQSNIFHNPHAMKIVLLSNS